MKLSHFLYSLTIPRSVYLLVALVSTFIPAHSKITIPLPASESVATNTSPVPESLPLHKNPGVAEKEWNFLVYIAGNNNLHRFINYNLNHMASVGSNDRINIIAHVEGYGKDHISRLYIEKGTVREVQRLEATVDTITGTPQSFYGFIEWALKNYPAKHTAIVLWNHGSGSIDPSSLRTMPLPSKGIAFNDKYNTYLTNQDLNNCLKRIKHTLLKGKKIDILAMDACVMGQLEIASECADSVSYFIASQESVLAYGWRYDFVLEPFMATSLSPKAFATHIVDAFKRAYITMVYDFTHAAYDLEKLREVESSVDEFAQGLLSHLDGPHKKEFFSLLKNIRMSELLTTSFFDDNYIDLHRFYLSVLNAIKKFHKMKNDTSRYANLIPLIHKGIHAIHQMVVQNTAGAAIPHAYGVSVYYPSRYIHSSYYEMAFSQNNRWLQFLERYNALLYQ